MKLHRIPLSRAGVLARGYTLVEMLFTLVIMVLAIGAVLAAYIYSIKMTQFTRPKLGASDEARQAISLITDEIRSARSIKIGTGTLSSFTEVGAFSAQVGNALQLHPTTNTSQFIRYYWDSADKKLKRTTDGASSSFIVANSVSNQMVFTAEDFKGNTLSNNYNNRIISMTLNFYQIQYPITAVGPGNYYDYYQLRARITRRTLL